SLLEVLYLLSFFFSSRRRHTRSKRDWSSDVCSSDLHYFIQPVWISGTFWCARRALCALMWSVTRNPGARRWSWLSRNAAKNKSVAPSAIITCAPERLRRTFTPRRSFVDIVVVGRHTEIKERFN